MMQLVSQSVKETLNLGRCIAKYLRQGDIVCLWGKLGSGKTVLTKGIALGLGIPKDDIISPTFVLIRECQEGKFPLYHFDLYRLDKLSTIAGLGYEEYFYGEGVSVIEWADRLKKLLPQEYLKIKLQVRGAQQRKIEISSSGRRYTKLIESLQGNCHAFIISLKAGDKCVTIKGLKNAYIRH